MKWIILLKLLLFLTFFSSCGFYNNQPVKGNNLSNQESNLETDSSNSSRWRSRSSSGGGSNNNNDDDDDDDDDDHHHDIDKLHRITASGVDVESLLRSAVSLYSLTGECNSRNLESAHKTCVTGCYRASNPLSCVRGCDSRNSCQTIGSICSGVFQARNRILTNHHCVKEDIASYTENGKYYYSLGTVVENHSGQRRAIRAVKWYDTASDIALAELDGELSNAQVPDFGRLSSLSLLDELFTIGSPNGIKWTASLGHLTNKEPQGRIQSVCRHCITFSIPIGGGSSGGPIFNHEGKLMALVSGYYIGYDSLNFGPHIDRIRHLINQNGSNDVTRLASYQHLRDSGLVDKAGDFKKLVLQML